MSGADTVTDAADKGQGMVPKLRFPEFQNAGPWPVRPLSALAKRRSKRNSDHEITRVLTNSAEHGVVDQRDYFEKDIATQGNLDAYFVVEHGDYVYNPRISNLAPVGPIGKNNVGTGVMSPLYTVFRFSGDDDSFFEHYFRSTCWHGYLRQVSNSGARHDRMAISNDAFFEMPLPAPSTAEQEKIADCLSSLGALIAAEADKLEALRDQKKGLMQQLFPAEGENIPRLRFPEFCNAGEWRDDALGMISEMKAGKFVAASDISEQPIEDRYPCYGGNGLRGYTQTHTHTGTFSLIGRQGALCGNVNLVTGSFHATEHAIVATPKTGVLSDWLFYALASLNLNKFATGQAQPGLSVDVLKNVLCPFPQEEQEQKLIADCLSSADSGIAAQSDRIEILKAHQSGLMQQLFSSVGEAAA